MTVKQFIEKVQGKGYDVVIIKTWHEKGQILGTLIADSEGQIKPIEKYNDCEVWHFKNDSTWTPELQLWVDVKELKRKKLL